jgi:hypothetical protein
VLKQEAEKRNPLEFCTGDSRLKVGKKSKDFLRTDGLTGLASLVIKLEGK